MRPTEVPRLLATLGIRAEREGRKFVATCPNPEHLRPPGKKSTPSWGMVAEGEDTGSHHCFGCGFGGGPWELVAAVRNLTLEEAGVWVRKEFAAAKVDTSNLPSVRIRQRHTPPAQMVLPPHVHIPSVDGSSWFAPAYEYLTKPIEEGGRGVEPWQLERWHIGYATRGRLAYRVVVPVYTRSRLLSYVARTFIGAEQRYDVARGHGEDPGARPHVALFGEPGWDSTHNIAVVAEGVFGMLRLEQSGAPNPCAILGASNLGPEKVDLLSQFALVLVATDPDLAGDKAYTTIHDALCRWTEVRRVPLPYKPDEAAPEDLRTCWESVL